MSNTRTIAVQVARPCLTLPPPPPARPVAKVLGIAVIAVVGLGAIIGGLQEASPLARIAVPLVGGVIILLLATMLVTSRRREGLVRANAEGGALSFVSSPVLPAILLLAAIAMVIIAAAGFLGAATATESGIPGPDGGVRTRYGGIGVMALLGCWGLADATGRLWPPRGLTLSETGVTWRASMSRTTIDWADIGEVSLVYERDQLCLALCTARGRHWTVYAMTTGSDPHIVAETIVYYRDHPDSRGALSDPHRALAAIGLVR